MNRPDDHAACSPDLLEEWQNRWTDFRAKHHAWWQRASRGGPAYTLSAEVIQALEAAGRSQNSPKRPRTPLINEDDAAAEREFTAVCKSHSDTVGVWGTKPIIFQLFAKRQSEKDWGSQLCHQLLGYIGWLLINRAFCKELLELKETWLKLPDHQTFPCLVGWVWTENFKALLDEKHDTTDYRLFHRDMCRFATKWQLHGLVTWEIPFPRVPLSYTTLHELNQLSPPTRTTGLLSMELERLQKLIEPSPTTATTLVLTVPFYYDITSLVNFRQLVREWQRRAADKAGHHETGRSKAFPVTETSGRNGRPSQYESAFRFWLIEHTIRLRYGHVRGMATRLENALTKQFGISPARFKAIRGLYQHLFPKSDRTQHE